MKKILICILATICLIARKEEDKKGSIYGTVTYSTGEPVAAATVTLKGGNKVFSEETATTGSDGYYSFDNVDAESVFVSVWAEKNGRKRETIDLYIASGKSTKIDIMIK